MRFATLFCSALLIGTCLAQSTSDSVNFKRTFKDNEVEVYKLELTPHGATKPQVSANFEITVEKLVGDGARMTYKALAKDMFPTESYKVGPDAMPSDFSNKNQESSGGPLFCSACWITPNAACEVGKPIPIHWKNDDKDISLDGQGVISNVDKATKSISVDWEFTIAFSSGKGVVKVKSVYSTDDFSLISAKATASSSDPKDQPFTITMTRVAAKS